MSQSVVRVFAGYTKTRRIRRTYTYRSVLKHARLCPFGGIQTHVFNYVGFIVVVRKQNSIL